MKVEVVFQENYPLQFIRKNDIHTYEKLGYNIRSFINGIQIIDDFEEDYTNEDWLCDLINGINSYGVKYEILKIEL